MLTKSELISWMDRASFIPNPECFEKQREFNRSHAEEIFQEIAPREKIGEEEWAEVSVKILER